MHIFRLVFVLNFSLKWQFSFYGPNSTGKGIFDLNKKKLNTPIEFCIFELD